MSSPRSVRASWHALSNAASCAVRQLGHLIQKPTAWLLPAASSSEQAGSRWYCADPLEPRRLLAGVTLIVHGADLGPGSSTFQWQTAMADEIAQRAGAGTLKYNMVIKDKGVVSDDGSTFIHDLRVTAFDLEAGATLTSPGNANAEVVIKVNWRSAAGVLNPVSTGSVAETIYNYLIASSPDVPNLGTGALPKMPFHLIGHSRGGALVSELAHMMGKRGLWIDQVTLLDPHPVNSDTSEPIPWLFNYGDSTPTMYDNVIVSAL